LRNDLFNCIYKSEIANPKSETKAGHTIGNQIIRSGASVAANYRAACRARSNADFISKITIVEEECDESHLWLELIIEANLLKKEKLHEILKEADELAISLVRCF
jgi:four helix bundle protein